MRDIVYFLQEELPLEGAELRYSLRSLVNIPHGNVWFLGPTVPEWVQGVIHIPWPQQVRKFYDLQEKFKALQRCEEPDMSDEIYVMHDDVYIVEPTQAVPLYWNARLEGDLTTHRRHQYDTAAFKTYWRMRELGWEGLVNPVIHQPIPVTRSDIPVDVDDGKGPYCWQMLWLNYVTQQGGEAVDMSMHAEPGFLVETKALHEKAVQHVLDVGFGLLSTLEGKHEAVFDVLSDLFPEKCEYEV